MSIISYVRKEERGCTKSFYFKHYSSCFAGKELKCSSFSSVIEQEKNEIFKLFLVTLGSSVYKETKNRLFGVDM